MSDLYRMGGTWPPAIGQRRAWPGISMVQLLPEVWRRAEASAEVTKREAVTPCMSQVDILHNSG